ncbi:MAG: hypothetical protein QM726_18730 [Chitinophagaceae bacterium]
MHIRLIVMQRVNPYQAIKLLIANCSFALLPGFLYATNNNRIDSLVPVLATNSIIKSAVTANDSLLPKIKFEPVGEELAPELAAIEAEYSGKEKNKNTLRRLLKVMRVKRILHTTKSRQRLLADIAGVSARLKLYPFAMQCYYLSTADTADIINDDPLTSEFEQTSFALTDTNAITLQDDWQKESIPVNAATVAQPFNDGKEVLACALVLHIKQPLPGKRKAFAGVNNVGHMFITLIKYNTDKSIVTKTFGFYPEKSAVFDGTPLHPSSASVIKDDSFHAWDEAAGKFISYRRMQRILRLLEKYQNKKYHLNNNNCTDFGLNVAMIGGIDLENTKGKWPLGKGNNPGAAGQSLLEGKLKNIDTGTKAGLFLCNSNEPFAPILTK